jgi:(p)ppGpp synthase/HD superfamily hydrolase
MSIADRALVIAEIAHTARGQMRADNVTPYIVHPMQVAEYTTMWSHRTAKLLRIELDIVRAAAYLHDVLEDTKVSAASLRRWSIPDTVIDLVLLLTKPGVKDAPEADEYFRVVGANPATRLIKAADICANLDDCIHMAKNGGSMKRWSAYMRRCYEHGRAMLLDEPFLLTELDVRLGRLGDTILAAEARDRAEAARYDFGA